MTVFRYAEKLTRVKGFSQTQIVLNERKLHSQLGKRLIDSRDIASTKRDFTSTSYSRVRSSTSSNPRLYASSLQRNNESFTGTMD